MVKKKVKKKTITKINKSTNHYWFKANKGSDWGIIPLNWKGYLALILILAVNIFGAQYFRLNYDNIDGLFKYLVVFLLSLFVFIQFSLRKSKK